MNAEVVRLSEAVREAGGRAMLVGGWVRDKLLGGEANDFDVEVYGLEPELLRKVLEGIGQVNTVGEHFSVYKVVFPTPLRDDSPEARLPSGERVPPGRLEIDVSLPRRESKSGRGHRGFVIAGDPWMRFEDAARRRDFTINAILLDPLTGEFIDPYNGRADLQRRILRAVAADTFIEDSLRVLRAMQLTARFGMTIEAQTIALCRSIDLSDLPRERIWGEIEKLLMLAERPSLGLDAAVQLNVFEKLFPEFLTLLNPLTERSSGTETLLTHTKLALDAAVKLVADLPKPKRIAVLLAVLCHDLSGPTPIATSAPANESPDHDHALRDATRSVLSKLGLFGIGGYDVRSQVFALVSAQRKPANFYSSRESTTDGDFRRLAQRVDLDLLYRVSKACARGQTEPSTVAEDWFIERARALGVEHGPPAPVLLGRHLLEAGFEPGPQMGRLLREVYERQLDGEVTTMEEALGVALRTGQTPPKVFR